MYMSRVSDVFFQYLDELNQAEAVFLTEAVIDRGVDVEYADGLAVLIDGNDDFRFAVGITCDVAGEFMDVVDDEDVVAPECRAAYAFPVIDPDTCRQPLERSEDKLVGCFFVKVESRPVDILQSLV